MLHIRKTILSLKPLPLMPDIDSYDSIRCHQSRATMYHRRGYSKQQFPSRVSRMNILTTLDTEWTNFIISAKISNNQRDETGRWIQHVRPHHMSLERELILLYHQRQK
jgi:hypothetical protein